MTEFKMKPQWQEVEDVNWDEFEKAIGNSKTKQQIILHLRNLIERKGYANMLRAAEIAFNLLVEVLPGNKGSIGVHSGSNSQKKSVGVGGVLTALSPTAVAHLL